MPLPNNMPLMPGLSVLDRVASQWKNATGMQSPTAVQNAKKAATRPPKRSGGTIFQNVGRELSPQQTPFLNQMMQSGMGNRNPLSLNRLMKATGGRQPSRSAFSFGNFGTNPRLSGFGMSTGNSVRDRAFAKLGTYSFSSPQATTATPLGDASQASSGVAGVGQWEKLVRQVANESGVPYEVLASIMAIESGGNANARADTGSVGEAVGLMQVVPYYWQSTANKYGGNLWDPYTNLRTAADILSGNYSQYGSWDNAAAAYFGGAGAFANGGYSNASDTFGTNIQAYVNMFRNNMSYFGYGGGSAAEQASGGASASNYAYGAVQMAATAIGAPYVWGGESWSEGGFDCSGLIQWAYGQYGKNPGRTAAEQYQNTARISANDLQPGDLIFYSDGSGITHVAIYAGNGEIIDAPSEGKTIRRIPMNTPWYAQHTVGFGRVM